MWTGPRHMTCVVPTRKLDTWKKTSLTGKPKYHYQKLKQAYQSLAGGHSVSMKFGKRGEKKIGNSTVTTRRKSKHPIFQVPMHRLNSDRSAILTDPGCFCCFVFWKMCNLILGVILEVSATYFFFFHHCLFDILRQVQMCLAWGILRAATNKYGRAHHQYPLPISKNLWKCRLRIEMLSKVRAAQKKAPWLMKTRSLH